MPNKSWRVAGAVLRVLLALLFAVSAVAKLFAIDDFELYIFSFGFLPLNFCYFAARLCIGVELAMALLIAAGLWRRWVNMAALLLLVAFSLFLCYAMIVGRTDSCQCFGRLADMPPAVSLLKNAVLIVLVLLYMKSGQWPVGSGQWPVGSGQWPVASGQWSEGGGKSFRIARLVFIALSVLMLAVPFVVSVPDNWMYGPEDVRFNRVAFDEAIGEGGELAGYGIGEGRHIVAFVTPGCPYCRMTRQKLGSIAERHDIAAERIIYLEPEQIGVPLFMNVTRGMRPLVMLVDNGRVTATCHYRNISERQVADFLGEAVDK